MYLIDTSVWLKYFRGEGEGLALKSRILDGSVVVHTLVLGELLLGGLSQKNEDLLTGLERCDIPDPEVIIERIKTPELAGKAIGWVDAVLIVSALKSKYKIATFDNSLQSVARDFDVIASL